MGDNDIIIEREQKIALYEDEWTEKMVMIWHEKLDKFKAIDTGNLYMSVRGEIIHEDVNAQIMFSFALYGIFVNNGTGNFYKKGNGGDLPFLGKDYRREHGLNIPKRVGPAWGGKVAGGHPRKEKPWVFRRYYASCRKLGNVIAEMRGEEYMSILCSTFRTMFDDLGTVTVTEGGYVR